MKWYKYRNIQTKEQIWWTQRDNNGNCFEIIKEQGSDILQLYVNEILRENYDSLSEAQNDASKLWVA